MDFKIGDIITAYHKGYWRLSKIEKRFVTEDDLRYSIYKDKKIGDEISPLFYYTPVMTENFAIKKGKAEKVCDASFCKKINPEKIEEMKKEYIKGCDSLLSLIGN